MLVERGLQVMNIEVVADAYAIAANFLRKTGAIADGFANERLLEIIVQLFQRGESLPDAGSTLSSWLPPGPASSCTPRRCTRARWRWCSRCC